MHWEWFVTARLAFNRRKSFSGFIVSVAVIAVALSISVMIIATSLVNGFQREISGKVFGFWGHVHVTHYDVTKSFEEKPVLLNQDFLRNWKEKYPVQHVQVYAHKFGIIKTEDEIEGIVLKGTGPEFNWDFFNKNLLEGQILTYNDSLAENEMIISAYTARRLKLKVGDEPLLFFIQRDQSMKTRYRKLRIVGIYNTGLEEYDKFYALTDLRHVQSLNNWNSNQVGGYEIHLHSAEDMDFVAEQLYYNDLGNDMYAYTIKEVYPNIFDWLSLQNLNEIVILLIMLVVAAINMITALLVLILERTNMIGILKALGATNFSIRLLFTYNASIILFLGLGIGNFLGLGLCWLQKQFAIIKLEESSYYVSVAPVWFDWGMISLLNLGTIAICLSALLLHTYIVKRISPVKAIRFA